MLRIAICDDQTIHLSVVHKALENYLDEKKLEAEIHDYTSAGDLLSFIEEGNQCDVAILDICIPDMLGTDLAREVRRLSPRTSIIFLSVSRDYAVEAFALGAVHYVLKPFSDSEFFEAMDRALVRNEKEKKLLLSLGNGIVESVDISTISYIESVAYRREVHTDTAVYEETRQTLHSLHERLEELSPGQFIQPYRGYIVNLDAIRTISSDKIIMQNGDFILIKRGDFRHLKDLFFKWSFRGRNLIV